MRSVRHVDRDTKASGQIGHARIFRLITCRRDDERPAADIRLSRRRGLEHDYPLFHEGVQRRDEPVRRNNNPCGALQEQPDLGYSQIATTDNQWRPGANVDEDRKACPHRVRHDISPPPSRFAE